MILGLFVAMIGFNLLVYCIYTLFSLIREARYQKLWNEEKATLLRISPDITRGELCEYFVMFCKRNDCIVEF